ncbi:MAG: FAD-dependent monooxygenase [Defluviicoccus sp.]|nr:MAG: FAD-dependent monooxygenase [Defluviicoccus sp.]
MAKLVMDGEHVTLYALPDEAEPLNWMWYVNIPERDLPHLLTDRNGQRHLWSLPPGALHAEIDDKMRAIARSRLPSWMNSLIDTTETLFLQPIYSGVAKRTTGSGVALVGDAAHLAVPHVGAGVTLAVEDSFTLAEIVAGGREDLEARLNVWAQERKAAVIARLAFAVRLGKSLQTGGKSWESWSQESYHAWWGACWPVCLWTSHIRCSREHRRLSIPAPANMIPHFSQLLEHAPAVTFMLVRSGTSRLVVLDGRQIRSGVQGHKEVLDHGGPRRTRRTRRRNAAGQ